MRLIKINNQIASLENVIGVSKSTCKHEHTKHGQKYSLYDTIFDITYIGGEKITISVDNEIDSSTPAGNATYDLIFDILSK